MGYPFTNPLIPPSPTPDPIPPLISAHGIDEGDVTVLLGSVSKLPFPTAFKTLLVSSMALWAASAPDVATVKSLGLDEVIDGFLEFISPPTLPTTVSPVRLPVEIPPTPHSSVPLLPSPLPRDEDAITPSSHLCTPMPHPLEKGKMRAHEPSEVPGDLTPTPVAPSPLPAPSSAPIDLVSPAVMVEAAGKKKGKKQASFAEVAVKAKTAPGPPNPPLGPKALAAQLRAANPPPPPRPSLVLSLTYHTLIQTLRAKAATAPPALVNVCNSALSADPIHTNVWVSAAKWTPKGNLVVFAGPGISREALFATSPLLTAAVSQALPDEPVIFSHQNVKWGKVMVSSVPTGVVEGHPHAHSPAACWQTLIDNNPSLRHLKVCQLPSWVRRPSLYHPGLQSSLVFAFEDLDGTLAPSLIRACNVYAFGSQCCVVCWRNPPPSPAKQEALDMAQKAQSAQSVVESVAGSRWSQAPLPMSVTQLAALTRETVKDGTLSAILEIATTLASSSKRAPTSLPSSAQSSKRKTHAQTHAADAAAAVP